MPDKRINNGGARKGAGRPPSTDPKQTVIFYIRKSKVKQARKEIAPIVKRINKQP